VTDREPGAPRPHWSDVLGDVADLGARVEEARQSSMTAAAEGSETGLIGGTSVFTIGEPPPRTDRRRVAEPRPAPALLDSPTVVIGAPPAPAPAKPPGTPVIGPPPPRMPRGATAAPGAPVAAPPEQPAPPAPPVAPAGGRRLLKDNLVVAAGTALSRITGVARLLAVYLLSRRLADAYLLANNTPNIVYELILGGILTATLVPLFTQHLEADDEDATSAVVSVTLVALAALTAIAFVVAPLLILFYGQNVDGDDRDQFLRVGLYLSVLFVPQVFFYGCMALGSALLNARRRFFAAAWAPVLNNLVVVTVLVIAGTSASGKLGLDDVDSNKGLLVLLGLGTTSGIAAMALSLLPALRRAGVRIRFRPRLRHPAVRAAAGLSGWTLGYVIANQVAAQTVLFLAVEDAGSVRSYQVGFIFFQLPHGLLAVSLMTTFQPDLARAFVQRAWPTFHARLLQGLRLLVAVMVPAAVGYLTLAVLVVQRGPDAEWFRPERGLGEAVPVAQAPLRAPGLLRRPGHEAAVLDQRRRERRQHRHGGRPHRPVLAHLRADGGLLDRLPGRRRPRPRRAAPAPARRVRPPGLPRHPGPLPGRRRPHGRRRGRRGRRADRRRPRPAGRRPGRRGRDRGGRLRRRRPGPGRGARRRAGPPPARTAGPPRPLIPGVPVHRATPEMVA
jgi:O-antigen/teichoic acid export membrane protein